MNTDTKFSPTASLGFSGQHKADMPPLAQFRKLEFYTPQYGDYFVWSKWFSTWHGIVKFHDLKKDELHIIFAGVPFLLFIMTDKEQDAETYKINLAEIKNAKQGKYAVQQSDKQGATIWYI